MKPVESRQLHTFLKKKSQLSIVMLNLKDETMNLISDKMQEVVKASEDIAEKRAHQIVRKEFDEFSDITDKLRPRSNSQTRQFDKIYHDPKTNRFVIIEAKGGSSPLGAAKGNQQGTSEYFDELVNYLGKARKDSEDLIKKLEKAKDRGELDYLLVKQKFDVKTGELLPTEVQKFKL